jgi:hypothetical protein|tara:strand:- start:784 stop:1203 length:420 start_codon:yes stop_codon:yes gene_type:complete
MSELASPTGILLILILLGLGASFGVLLLKYGEMLKQIADLETYLHNLEKQADHNSGVLFRVADMADQLRIATAENTTSIDAMRREMGHLSDDVRGEVGTSRAIEMARSGASKADIAAKTGLPIEEAEALVTFHGKKRKS